MNLINRITKILYSDNFIGRTYKVLSDISDRADKTHIYMLSAGIAFNILVYLIPLFLVSIYVINLIVNIEDLALTVEKLLSELLPPTQSTQEFLSNIVIEVRLLTAHSKIFGIIGIGALLWISSILISSIRFGINTVFELPSEKFFLLYRLKDILLTIIFCVLVMIYTYVVPMTSVVAELLKEHLPTNIQGFFSDTFLLGLSLVTSLLIFYVIFTYVPNKKVIRFIRYLSIILSVFFIEISRHIFAWYIGSVSNYGKFYGGYAILISVAIWIYYSSLIILFSGLISKFIYDKWYLPKRKKFLPNEE